MGTKLFMALLFCGASLTLLGQGTTDGLNQYFKHQRYTKNAVGKFLRQSDKEIADSFTTAFPRANDVLFIQDYRYVLGKALFGAIYSIQDSLPLIYHRYDRDQHVIFHQAVPFADSLFYQKIKELFMADSLSFYEAKNVHAPQTDDEFDILSVIYLKREGGSYRKKIFNFRHPLAFRSEILSP